MSDQPTEEFAPLPHQDVETNAPFDLTSPRERAGCLKYVLGGMSCLLFLVVIVGALIFFTGATLSSVVGSVGGLFGLGVAAPPPVAEVISTQTIVQGIQPLGQLVSVSVQLAKADVFVGVGQGALNACGFSANHVVQGAVEAGIDLTQIGEDDLRFDAARQVYVLTIPAPQLTSCRIDFIRQYERSFTTCNVDWDEARLLANYITLNEFRDDAVEGGILSRAQGEARLVLGNFVRLLTGHPVEIVFAPPESAVLPPSCSPEAPQGWSFNPQNGHWTK